MRFQKSQVHTLCVLGLLAVLLCSTIPVGAQEATPEPASPPPGTLPVMAESPVGTFTFEGWGEDGLAQWQSESGEIHKGYCMNHDLRGPEEGRTYQAVREASDVTTAAALGVGKNPRVVQETIWYLRGQLDDVSSEAQAFATEVREYGANNGWIEGVRILTAEDEQDFVLIPTLTPVPPTEVPTEPPSTEVPGETVTPESPPPTEVLPTAEPTVGPTATPTRKPPGHVQKFCMCPPRDPNNDPQHYRVSLNIRALSNLPDSEGNPDWAEWQVFTLVNPEYGADGQVVRACQHYDLDPTAYIGVEFYFTDDQGARITEPQYQPYNNAAECTSSSDGGIHCERWLGDWCPKPQPAAASTPTPAPTLGASALHARDGSFQVPSSVETQDSGLPWADLALIAALGVLAIAAIGLFFAGWKARR